MTDVHTDVVSRPTPDEIRGRIEALQSLGGAASREDVRAEIQKLRGE